MSQTPDLRQKRLLEPYEHLTPRDTTTIHYIATKLNTQRRIEEAMAEGSVPTPSFIPDFLEDNDYITILQRLAFLAIRGYMSEHRKPATLVDIFRRVEEKVRSLQRDGSWPPDWRIPSKRTIDRRVNEIASTKPENHIMKGDSPQVLCTRPGEYVPNPALYEDVAKILEEPQ